MHFLKIAVVEAALALSGNSFQDLTARTKNERLANSVRARGTSRWPALTALVARDDTSDRRLIRDRSSSGEVIDHIDKYAINDKQ